MTATVEDYRLPHDEAAERAIVGAALMSASARDALAREGVTAAEFYDPHVAAVWAAVAALHDAGRPVDTVTVASALRASGDLARVGGQVFLYDLLAGTPTAANAVYYARIVRAKAVQRRLVTAGTRIVQLGRADDGGDVEVTVAAALAEVTAVARGALAADDRASTATEILYDLIESLDQPVAHAEDGPRWGWRDVDGVMNKLSPGKLVVIGGRPGVGKSLVLGGLAASCAFTQDTPTVLHTLEMSRLEVMQRLLASAATVELSRIIRHELEDRDLARVMRVQGDLMDKPLVIDETRGLTVAGLRASIRRHRPRVVIVDYLQLMRATRPENRREEVSSLARDLKELAGDEQVAVVTGAQLNRNAADRAPQLSDLRESGEIEQSADEVLLLHVAPERDGERLLIVAKNRQGAASTQIHLADQAHYGRLSDLAH